MPWAGIHSGARLKNACNMPTQMPHTQANVFDEVDRAATELANISNRDGSTFMQMNSPKSAYQWEGILTPHWTCTFRPEINDSFGISYHLQSGWISTPGWMQKCARVVLWNRILASGLYRGTLPRRTAMCPNNFLSDPFQAARWFNRSLIMVQIPIRNMLQLLCGRLYL